VDALGEVRLLLLKLLGLKRRQPAEPQGQNRVRLID
jgi:hypothetical protein